MPLWLSREFSLSLFFFLKFVSVSNVSLINRQRKTHEQAAFLQYTQVDFNLTKSFPQRENAAVCAGSCLD